MKKLILSSIVACTAFFTSNTSFGQATVGMDFNRADCNGTMHHLFTNDLDSGNVVILEFFMGGGCVSCITAGQTLEIMKTGLNAAHPGKIRAYVSGYQNSMPCSTVLAWTMANGITSTPIDSGASQVAYYGGFGMPTIVILAGNDHKVIYTDIGFSSSDTVGMKDSISKFFNSSATGITEHTVAAYSLSLSPNPASNVVNLSMQIMDAGELTIDIADFTGKTVMHAVNDQVTKGSFVRAINTTNLANGLYLLRATLNGATSVSKITIAK